MGALKNNELDFEQACRLMASDATRPLGDLDEALDLWTLLTIRGMRQEAQQARNIADKIQWWLHQLGERDKQIQGLRRDIPTFDAIFEDLESLVERNPGEQGLVELLGLRGELRLFKIGVEQKAEEAKQILRDPQLADKLEARFKRQSVH